MAIPAGYTPGRTGYFYFTDGSGPYTVSADGVATLVTAASGQNTDWYFSTITGGLLNTADVVIKAAPGAAWQIKLSSMQVQNAGIVGSEVIIFKGVNTAILWRGYVPANTGLPIVILRGLACSPNTLLGAKVLTASTIHLSAQGYLLPV